MTRWLFALILACACGPCCPCDDCPCEGQELPLVASYSLPVAVQFNWSPPAAHHEAVVAVQAGNRGGSGVYVECEGVFMVLTCEHVAVGGSTMTAKFRDGTVRSGSPRTDKFGHDVAGMLVEKHPTVTPIQFAPSIPTPTKVEMLGYAGPAGRLRHWWGSVARDSSIAVTKYDAGVGSGDSGGPVLNEQGQLIGLLAHGEQPNNTDGWATYNRAGGPAWTPLRNFAIRLRAFSNPSGTNPPLNERPAGGCGPGGCPPYGGGGYGGGGLYPPSPDQYPQQPTPAAPGCQCPDYAAQIAAMEAKIANLELQGLVPGPAGKDGKDGKSPSADEIAAKLQPSLPTADAIASVLFVQYGDQLADNLKAKIPPLYVEVIDPTGKYSAPPQAIRFMEGEGLRLVLDPTQLVLPKAD